MHNTYFSEQLNALVMLLLHSSYFYENCNNHSTPSIIIINLMNHKYDEYGTKRIKTQL